MLKAKKYDEKTRIEECFYDSSNVFYSACYDKVDDYKQLTVVFSKGDQYVYNDIDVHDYLKFRDAQSQGKALNEFIAIKPNGKAKYAYKRLTPVNLDELKAKLAEWQNEGGDDKQNEEVADYQQLNNDEVVVEVAPKAFTIKAGGKLIPGFDTEDLNKVTLLLDALQVNYRKIFLK